MSNLFKPITIGHNELRHRVAMAPLTRRRADEDGVPSQFAPEYYKQRAQSPGTLIVTEAVPVHASAVGLSGVPGIYTADQVAGWKKISDAIHSQKSFVFMQLWAVGRKGSPEFLNSRGFEIVSSSSKAIDGLEPHALTKSEIKDYVGWYASAAKRAVEEAGMDGVEIHMANGYLIEQFLREQFNDRTDEYGGSVENRARFPIEVLDAVVAALDGDAKKVSLRLSPWTRSGSVGPGPSTLSEYSYLLGYIQKRYPELAYISIIEPRVALGHLGGEVSVPTRDGLDFDEWNLFVRLVWDGPLLRAGGLQDEAEKIADKDPRTLVGFGRVFISNPDLVERLRTHTPLAQYDRTTFYTGGPRGYIDYPNAK